MCVARFSHDDPTVIASCGRVWLCPADVRSRYVQQYNDPPVYNLVSICGVQNGVFDCPLEVKLIPFVCDIYKVWHPVGMVGVGCEAVLVVFRGGDETDVRVASRVTCPAGCLLLGRRMPGVIAPPPLPPPHTLTSYCISFYS